MARLDLIEAQFVKPGDIIRSGKAERVVTDVSQCGKHAVDIEFKPTDGEKHGRGWCCIRVQVLEIVGHIAPMPADSTAPKRGNGNKRSKAATVRGKV